MVLCLSLGTLCAQKVGVNIDPPEFLLDVRGLTPDTGSVINLGSQDNSHFMRFFSGRSGDPNPFIWWKQGDPLRFAVGDGGGTFIERMRIRSGGTVGINNTNPQHALHVNEPAGVSLSNGVPVILGHYTGTNTQDVIGIQGVCKPVDYYGIGGAFEGGYVGVIGTVLPTGSNSYTGVRGIAEGGSGTNYGVYGDASGSGTNWAGYFVGGNVFVTNKLGIGQLSPLWPIDMNAVQAVIRMNTTSNVNGSVLELRSTAGAPVMLGAINFNNNANGYPGQIGYTNDHKLTFRTNGHERMQIDASGNVNIGTTPFVGIRLNVDGGIAKFDDGVVAYDDNAGVENIAVYGSATGATTNWAAYFPNGNVHILNELRIGTTDGAAGYLVSVNGKMMCEELKVQLQENWPDYVFDKGYALRSISQLENEIKEQGHLPGVPSAAAAQDGIEVGEMQRVLLEKVEELTLYIIELQKQIDILEVQVQAHKE
jgi:hypothetical protein